MLRYTLRRLAWLPVILIATSILTFWLLRVLPGQDPAEVIAGQGAQPAQLERIREELGLAKPIFPVSVKFGAPPVSFNRDSQYSQWVGEVLTGDFGRTYTSEAPVREEFTRRFWFSFEIVLLSLLISSVFGITFGILSAVMRNTPADYGVRTFAVFGASIPEFFLLALLIVIPAYLWNYSQPVGPTPGLFEDPMRNMRLFLPPALVLGISGSAALMRLVRTSMLEVLRADYVRTARSKGLSRSTVILVHGLKNCSSPILTAVGTSFIAVFGGSIIAERVMGIQGLGIWFFTSALSRDLPVVQFLAIYTAGVVVLINLLVDLSYGWADPRVRYS